MTTLTQIHLIAPSTARKIALHTAAIDAAKAKGAAAPPMPTPDFRRYSGRGVRLRILSPEERETVTETAAKFAGPDATLPEYSAIKLREGVRRMIVAVTRESELADLGGAEWIPVTQFELEDPKGPKSFSFFFTSKDAEMLNAIFNRLHSITAEELDYIEGNAVEVTV